MGGGAVGPQHPQGRRPKMSEKQFPYLMSPETIADAVVWVLGTPEPVLVADVSIKNYRNPFEGKGSPFET